MITEFDPYEILNRAGILFALVLIAIALVANLYIYTSRSSKSSRKSK